MPRRPSRWAMVAVAAGATCLILYGLLASLIASAWGPGNSDELVSGGTDLIPWFGLSLGGTVAALVGLALVRRPRLARWALVIATVCLGSWTVFLFVGTNAD
jgi:hypothetical protein